MLEFYVFDLNLNRLGIIDDFVDVEIKQNYHSPGTLYITVEGSKDNVDLLQVDRILTKTNDLTKGYIIKTPEYMDEKSKELSIIAPSINVLLNDRLVLGQQEFTGSVENVMKSFVQMNAVAPANPNRIIPNLKISASTGIPIQTTEAAVNEPLCDYLYEISKKYDVSFDVLLDHTNKKFVFNVWQGADRSTEQSANPHVIFAKEFDNVLKQHYTVDAGDYKTTAIVLGEEIEGQPQQVVTVRDEKTGFTRKELLVDSSKIKKTYKDAVGNDITLTDPEYRKLLEEAGNNSLFEYPIVKTFESDVDPEANFKFGIDYFMGDKVSIRNDDLDIILHTRVTSTIEKVTKQGYSLQLNFGSNIPTFIDKVKRAVK